MSLAVPSQSGNSIRAGRILPFGTVVSNLQKSLQWAWLDTKCQYRRSRIGPIWETINVIVMLCGLSLVSSAVFGSNVVDNIGYIAIGIIIWTAMSALITEGSSVFVRNAPFVNSSSLSVDIYVGRSVFKILINFAHHSVIYFLAVLFHLVPIGWTSLLAIPGIILLFVNGFWMVTFFGYICARYRDVELIIRNLLTVAFFVTPVFWNYRTIASNRHFIVDYNILFYFIEIIRAPLLGEVPPWTHYLTVLAVTGIGFGLAYYVHQRMRPNLAFYL
jgi:ABC-type polysaccharide/polyol phosphate export permease